MQNIKNIFTRAWKDGYLIIVVVMFLGLLLSLIHLEIVHCIWEFLNESLVSTIIGTLIGVYGAFRLSAYSERRIKERAFGILGDQVAFEWSANWQYIKDIIVALRAGDSTVLRLNTGMVDLALGGIYLYEFSTKDFIRALRIYKENVVIVNKLMDYILSRESLKQTEIDNLILQLEKVERYIDDVGKLAIR